MRWAEQLVSYSAGKGLYFLRSFEDLEQQEGWGLCSLPRVRWDVCQQAPGPQLRPGRELKASISKSKNNLLLVRCNALNTCLFLNVCFLVHVSACDLSRMLWKADFTHGVKGAPRWGIDPQKSSQSTAGGWDLQWEEISLYASLVLCVCECECISFFLLLKQSTDKNFVCNMKII